MPAANSSSASTTAPAPAISDRVLQWPYGDINGGHDAHSNPQSQAPTPKKVAATAPKSGSNSSGSWIRGMGSARPAETTTPSTVASVTHAAEGAMEGFNAERMVHWPFNQ